MRPVTHYARSGDTSIAYQTVGDGPVDLIFVPGFVSNIEYGWEEPTFDQFHRRLGSFARLIIFDKRGTGLSDRVTGAPTLETRMDDVRAVMDDVGSGRAAIVGYSEGAALAALFAATYPERTAALIMYAPLVAGRWSPESPWALTDSQWNEWLASVERRWGTPDYCAEQLREDAPSKIGDTAFEQWYGTRLRLGASPGAAAALVRMAMEIDISGVLPAIHVPTLVLHRSGDRFVDVRGSRYLAATIPQSEYLELPGNDHLPWVGESEVLAATIESFLSRVRGEGAFEEPEPDRVLATLLFTDIVGSTERAESLGDREWRRLLERHHDLVREELRRHRGQELDTAGDGFFARFEGPARAIGCAQAVVKRVSDLGLNVRAGLHTGECEIIGDKVSGIAVHIGARIAAEAGAGEILVSGTVRDLVAGSGIQFKDRGIAPLRGIAGDWRVFQVA